MMEYRVLEVLKGNQKNIAHAIASMGNALGADGWIIVYVHLHNDFLESADVVFMRALLPPNGFPQKAR